MKNRTFRQFLSRQRPRKRGVSRLFMLGAALAASATVDARPASASPPQDRQKASASPQGGAVRFEIPAGSIRDVMRRFEIVTGVRVTIAMDGIGDIQSPGVAGVFTPQQAIEAMLSGTSLSFVFTTPSSVMLDIERLSAYVSVAGEAPRPASPKYSEPLRDTPQTIVVIPQAVLQDQGSSSLRDALRNTPGITLTAGEGGTAPGDNFLIRGFSARNDVYVDGARDPGVANRDTFNTEAVEVAKGPSSATAGRGSTGGSINLVTKTANLQDAASVRMTGGNASYKRGSADINRRLGASSALRLNLMWQDAGVPRRDEVTQKGWGFAPSVGFGLGTRTSLTLNYSHLRQNNLPDYGLPGTLPDLASAKGFTVDALDFSSFYGLVGRDHEKTRADIATATVDHRLNRTLTLRNLTRVGRNNLDRVVTSPRAATAANAGTDPGFDASMAQIRRTDTKYQYRDDRTITNQTDLTMRFQAAGAAHSADVGLEIARDRQPSYAVTDAFSNGRPPVTDLFRPNPDDTYAPALVRTGAASAAHATSAALYAFDTVKPGDKWQIDLGGRLDRIDVDYDSMAATGVVTQFGRTDRAFSGRAGIVYKPTPRSTLYSAYSTSFNPSYDGSFGLTLAATGVNAAALPPERSRNVEVGAKWDLTPSLLATAAVFQTEKVNAKTTDASGATVLAGDQQVKGVELGVSGNLTQRWGLFGGVALMDGTVEESAVAAEVGRRLSYVPKTSFNLWSTYQLPARVTIGGGAQFTDGYFFQNTNALTTANAEAIQRLTRYWLFSAMGTYRANPHLSLQVNGMNLSNAKYVDRGYTGHFIPGAGRAVLAGPVFFF